MAALPQTTPSPLPATSDSTTTSATDSSSSATAISENNVHTKASVSDVFHLTNSSNGEILLPHINDSSSTAPSTTDPDHEQWKHRVISLLCELLKSSAMELETCKPGEHAPNKRRRDDEVEGDFVVQLLTAGPSGGTAPIIMEILARLPMKLLTDCRLSCKSWNDMLAEPYFSQVYLRRAPTVLLLPAMGNIQNLDKLRIIDIQSDCQATYREASLRSSPSHHKDFKFITMNSCNGLICLCDPESFEPISILDPIRGMYIRLPMPVTKSSKKVVSGFGYDATANSYKVIRILYEEGCCSNRWSTEILDFSKGANWTRATDAPYQLSTQACGVFVKGAMHWLVENSSNSSKLICSFNLHSERFASVLPPPIFDSSDRDAYYWSNLGVTGGNLSICAVDAKPFRPDFQIWVMEQGTWTKRLCIMDPPFQWWNPRRRIQVSSFLRDGSVLILCCHEQVLKYDPRARTFKTVKAVDQCRVVAHVPGFITLDEVVKDSMKASEIESLCAKKRKMPV
ncbi:hypothetical protein Ancab_008134 [Ancistrocladus abbreviatus]